MLDLNSVQKNRDLIEKSLADRKIDSVDLDKLFSLDKTRRDLSRKLDSLRSVKKSKTKALEERAIKGGLKKNSDEIKELRDLNSLIRDCEDKIASLEQQKRDILLSLPNIPHSSVPEGSPGKPNKIIKASKERKKFEFRPKNYLEIGRSLGIIDFPDTASVLDFELVLYKGAGSKLERALINFLMDLHEKNNYCEFFPPIMAVGWPVLKLIQGRVFNMEELPKGFTTYSLCFRKDWSFAEDLKEMPKRVRQFDSVDLTKIAGSRNSYELLDKLKEEVESVLELLGVPYETAVFSRGNLDPIASKAYSIKIVLPGMATSLEISVCSNLTDYFSREMNIRYKDSATKETKYPHILHANFIVPRAMMAILENFQQEDGSVIIPEVLRQYLGGLEKLE